MGIFFLATCSHFVKLLFGGCIRIPFSGSLGIWIRNQNLEVSFIFVYLDWEKSSIQLAHAFTQINTLFNSYGR
jgi:hypothetical protein